MAGSISELQQLTDKLYRLNCSYLNCSILTAEHVQRHTVWKQSPLMSLSLEKSKILVNEFSNSHSSVITMNGETLETVDKFKYLGATLIKARKVKRR